jgi:RNA polymerase sigma factor (sigma-70 family)
MRLNGMTTIGATERMRVGDQSALRDFCSAQFPALVGSLTLYCGDRGVAEELAQEALARACASWNKLQRIDSPGAWVHRVAINLANSHYRRKGAERRAREKLEARTTQVSPSRDQDIEMTLRREVAALPKRLRAALVLRYYSDLSVAATADALGTSEGSIKRLTHEAIAALRRNPRLASLEVRND